MRENFIWNYPLPIIFWQFNYFGFAWWFFIQDCAKLGL